jgi:hypothetical protein
MSHVQNFGDVDHRLILPYSDFFRLSLEQNYVLFEIR